MKRKPRYEIYMGEDDFWYWRLRAANGEIVASGEGYASKSNARRAAKRFRGIAAAAELPTN